MNTEELISHIDEGDYYEANALLRDRCPTAERRFKRLTRALADLLNEVKKEFPDANYYTASGGFNLLLGDATEGGSLDGNKVIALSASAYLRVGDGDF